MKKSILLSILTMLFLNTIIAQNTAITIIPKPNNITVLDGEFTIYKKTKIVGDAVTKDVVKLIQDYFKNTNNISVKESKKATKNTEKRKERHGCTESLGKEGGGLYVVLHEDGDASLSPRCPAKLAVAPKHPMLTPSNL